MQRTNWYNYFVVVVLILLGLWLWQRGKDQTSAPTSEEVELETRVNKFLENSGILLPEGIDRANLTGVADESATGVSTRRAIDSATEYTIIAALSDLSSGWYEGWLTEEDGSGPVSLGKLSISKGGFSLERVTSADWQSKSKVLVTHEMVMDDEPEDTVLEGSF